jgi:hypothetical protein
VRIIVLILSVLMFVSSTTATTIVLKNGRRYTGDLVSDDGRTVQLHESSTGVFLSFKKQQVDDAATAAANAKSGSQPRASSISGAGSSSQRLADVAREARLRRTGRARVYTSDDLKSAPQISISGSGEIAVDKIKDGGTEVNEAKWRAEARKLRKDVEAAEDRASTADRNCEAARAKSAAAMGSMHEKPQELNALMHQPAECARAADLKDRLRAARDRFAEFEDRARRASIPISWLD